MTHAIGSRALGRSGAAACALALASLLWASAADGSPYAYVLNPEAYNIVVVDLATDTVVETITRDPGWAPRDAAVTPDGSMLFVTAKERLYIYNVTPAGHLQHKKIPMGGHPTGVAVGPDGDFVYVVDLIDELVRKIPVSNLDVSAIQTIPMTDASGSPTLYARWVEVGAWGDTLFVAHDQGNVSIVDVPTGDVDRVSGVVDEPADMALLAGMAVVSDPIDNEVKLVFVNGGVATHAVSDRPTGVEARLENNGIRIHVTQQLVDRVVTVATGATLATGSAPEDVAYSPEEDVLVVANRSDQSVTVFRSPPVVIPHPDLQDARRIVIGPRLPEPEEPLLRIAFTGLEIAYAEARFVNQQAWKLELEGARLEGDPRFELVDDGCAGRLLAPDQACEMLVAFRPPEGVDGEEWRAALSVFAAGAEEASGRILLVASEDPDEGEGEGRSQGSGAEQGKEKR